MKSEEESTAQRPFQMKRSPSLFPVGSNLLIGLGGAASSSPRLDANPAFILCDAGRRQWQATPDADVAVPDEALLLQ